MSAAPSYEERIRAWSATPRWRAEAEALLDALALPPGAAVLDVGMGAGRMLALLRARGLAPTGLDRWDGWRARGDAGPAVRADARRLPFAAGTFDGVVLMHVLAHVEDPLLALAEARRVLRPAGRLAVATPNALFLRAIALPSALSRYRKDPTVVRHVSLRTLRRLAGGAGFRVRLARPWGKLPWTLPLPPLRERLFLVAEAPA